MDFSVPPPNYPQVQYSHHQAANNVHHQAFQQYPRPALPLQTIVQGHCATPGPLVGPDPRFSIPPPPINNQFRMQTMMPPVHNQTPVPLAHTPIPVQHTLPPIVRPPLPPMMYPSPAMTPTPPTLSEHEIPDMRPQFLTTQFHVQPGQVVMLPPLTGDRSMQTIQIMTPSHPAINGQTSYSVQTLVLPVMKVNQSGQQLPQQSQQHPDLIALPAKQETDNIITEEEMFLNKIDDTGLPQVMQGIDLDKVKQFALEFKAVRIKLGLTQSQVGAALNSVSGQGDIDQISVSQSTICRFEKLEITALQVKKLLPVLQSWMAWAQQRHAEGLPIMNIEGLDIKEFKKRKRRTVFIKETVDALNQEFEANTNPSSLQLSEIAERLGLCKETTRVWFCNKRQQLKKCAENVENSSL